jgi:hypothetical protein
MSSSIFTEEFAALEAAAERQNGLVLSNDLHNAMSALSDLPQVDVKQIAAILAECSSPTGAGFLAVWLGAGVERGKDADLTCQPILETFLKWSGTVETPPEREDAEADDDPPGEDAPEPDPETIAGLQLLGQSLVAHLARSPELLRAIAQTEPMYREFKRLEPLSYGAGWVMHLLRQRSGQLVVLNAGNKNGVIVRYENISNCFHLFTLLQGALAPLMPDAAEPSEQILDIARGRAEGNVQDYAWWHYSQPDATKADIAASVWGEMAPDGIASVDGSQVLVLWPPIIASRSWDAGFFLPILYASPPNVEVLEILSPAELDVWWEQLGLPEP